MFQLGFLWLRVTSFIRMGTTAYSLCFGIRMNALAPHAL